MATQGKRTATGGKQVHRYSGPKNHTRRRSWSERRRGSFLACTRAYQIDPSSRHFLPATCAAFPQKGRGPVREETTVVITDGALSAVQDFLHGPIPLNDYVSGKYRAELDRPEHSSEAKDVLRYLMDRRYSSLADVMLMKRLWTANALDPKQTSVVYSRDLRLRSFQKGNHILVGLRRAVPSVDLSDAELDFHFVYDERTPRENAAGERFSLVQPLPNSSKTGNVLILSGQERAGTEAAGQLITTERLLQEVLAKLPVGSGGAPYFEALLRVMHVEYTLQRYEILAVHRH